MLLMNIRMFFFFNAFFVTSTKERNIIAYIFISLKKNYITIAIVPKLIYEHYKCQFVHS